MAELDTLDICQTEGILNTLCYRAEEVNVHEIGEMEDHVLFEVENRDIGEVSSHDLSEQVKKRALSLEVNALC